MSTSRFTIDDIKDAISTRSRFTIDDIKDAISTRSLFTIDDIKDAISTRSRFTIDDIKDALSSCDWTNNISWNTNDLTEYLTFDFSEMTDAYKNITKTASKVIDSKVLGANDTVLMNWNTALFTNSNNSDMRSIFGGSSSTITEWNSDLSSLTNGTYMFYSTKLTSFNSDLSNLTDGSYMFYNTKLTSFDSDLSNLTKAYCMFLGTQFTSFDSDLPNLIDGADMIRESKKLTSFTSDLPSLTNGTCMFTDCTALVSFNSDLSSLTNGSWMFTGCTALETFTSDLPSLTNGYGMFGSTALTSFNSDLSSLTNGTNMFRGCKLDTTSVKNIADTINAVSSGSIHIGIGNSTPNTEEETSFNTMVSKGWTVYVNGSSTAWTPTASTNLTDEEQSASIPFYAKPIQVTEDVAEYVDSNNNYYNIVGAQFIYGDDISTYGQFTSFEHAVEEISITLGLTKYTKPTEEKVQ